MCVCVCLNFEDNDTKKASKIMWDVSQRELENLWNQVEKEKKKRVENVRVGERKREGGSGIESKVKKKKRRWWNPMGIRVWWTKCKRKEKEKKKRKSMDERKTKNKKSQFKNTITIFSQ